ncbi:MAG: phosphodiester glycosidase family protein [Gaiellales bacterium]
MLRGTRAFLIVTAALAILAGASPGAARAAHRVRIIRPSISGPVAYINCPPFPEWCKRRLRRGHGGYPGVTITHLRVHMGRGHGPVQDVYKVAWKLSDPYVHLDAEPLATPTASGEIPLTSISSWARWGAPAGFTAALNGDFFAQDWSTGAGTPSGMLVHHRHVISFGWGGPAVSFPSSGGSMKFASPRALPTRLPLPGTSGPVQAGIRAFLDVGKTFSNQVTNIQGDQVAVYNQQFVPIKLPAGYDGFVVGTSATPTPFRSMLTGSEHIANERGVGETVSGFHFSVAGAAPTSELVPVDNGDCPSYVCAPGTQLALSSGQSMLIARAGGSADAGLTQLAQGAGHALRVPLDASGWGGISEVMGGKPMLVANGMAQYTTPWHDPAMMSSDCWQWCYQHWRPAVAVSSRGYGWLIITGGSSQTGVYGWDWGRMLRQLGARWAIGFDNNSSTEIDAPGAGIFSFMHGWQRSITEATALSYRR